MTNNQEIVKTKRRPNMFVVTLLLLAMLPISVGVYTFSTIAKDIIPITRTQFRSYQEFSNNAEWTVYAPILPKSAYNIYYYYYEGFFSDRNGYHASFSSEDYEAMKLNCLHRYLPDFEGTYCYDGETKNYLDREQIKKMKVDYLDQLLPVENDNGQFYNFISEVSDSGEVYHYRTVLCNDDTFEIVELSCRICY